MPAVKVCFEIDVTNVNELFHAAERKLIAELGPNYVEETGFLFDPTAEDFDLRACLSVLLHPSNGIPGCGVIRWLLNDGESNNNGMEPAQ